MKYQKWHIGTASEQDTALLKEAGYPSLLATVLAARGITTSEAAAEALERETSLTISPMLMRDMDKAVARIQKALANDEIIAVFGDYDVDGITSTVLLLDYLKNCGAKCLRYIPRRIEDGYGLSKDAIQGLRDKGVTLMITVDCGITAVELVQLAGELQLPVPQEIQQAVDLRHIGVDGSGGIAPVHQSLAPAGDGVPADTPVLRQHEAEAGEIPAVLLQRSLPAALMGQMLQKVVNLPLGQFKAGLQPGTLCQGDRLLSDRDICAVGSAFGGAAESALPSPGEEG